MFRELLKKKLGCFFLSGLGITLLVLALLDKLPVWVQILFGSIIILITLAAGAVPFTNNRGEIQYTTEEQEADDEEDIELKGEILNTLFPGVPVDEESAAVVKKKDTTVAEGESDDGDVATGVACAICLEPFVSGDLVVSGVSCSHEYHRSCIMQWLLKKRRHTNNTSERINTCPTCRSPMWTQEEYEKAESVATAARSTTNNEDKNEDDEKKEATTPTSNNDDEENAAIGANNGGN